jgi:deoxyribonuclease V
MAGNDLVTTVLIARRFELPKDLAGAREIQKQLRRQIVLEDEFGDADEVKTVAGCDVAYARDGQKLFAAVVVVEIGSWVIKEKITVSGRVRFPYIPGFLSFREGPVLLEAIKRLKTEPDVFLFDGQGIAHPRRVGIASHLGVIIDKVSIGCAKSHLYGIYEEPARGKGAYSFIRDERDEKIGTVLRTKDGVRPVFVSPGHRVGLRMAAEIVQRCINKYRLPLPLRLAHIAANAGIK